MNRCRLNGAGACRQVLALLCTVYFAAYSARLNYAAVLAEILVSEHYTKAAAGLVTTAGFVAYGAGQLFSGWLGDRVSPRRLIFLGLAATAAFNVLLPLCPGPGEMTAVWGLNGLAQSLLWPPMVRLMAGYYDPVWFDRGCIVTSVASSAATVALYLIAPGLIVLGSWRLVFFVSAALAGTAALVWLFAMRAFEKKHGAVPVGTAARLGAGEAAENGAGEAAENDAGKIAGNGAGGAAESGAGGAAESGAAGRPGDTAGPSLAGLIFRDGLLFAMLAIVLQGILRDGVTTWLPSYLVEVYSLGAGSSILTSVVIPLFSIVSFWACSALNRKVFRNEIVCSAALFGAGFVLSAAMAALFGASAALSALLAALLTACMHGVNLMLICNLPARFASTGYVSTISGVLNACTYVGSALSAWGFALIAQAAGWRLTVVCWALVCAAGAAACLAARRRTRALFARL